MKYSEVIDEDIDNMVIQLNQMMILKILEI